jgi:hypothetical protein
MTQKLFRFTTKKEAKVQLRLMTSNRSACDKSILDLNITSMVTEISEWEANLNFLINKYEIVTTMQIHNQHS